MSKQNIHDKLFKQVFSIAAETKTFIQSFLSAEINEVLDTDTLVLENTSFINEQLQEYFSDIVWSCRTKNDREVKISLLLEHKSYADPKVPLQLLRYLTEAYDYQLNSFSKDKKGGSARLSLCIPVIVYHGKSRWKQRRLRDLFTLPDARFEKYLPEFTTDVIDLRSTTDQFIDQIERRGLLRVSFFLLRHFSDERYILENREKIIKFDAKLSEQERDVIFTTLMNYVDAAFKLSKKEYMNLGKAVMREMIEEKAYVPGSMVDQWVTEGMEKGIKKGRFLTELQTVIKLFPLLADDLILKISTTLSAADLKQMRQILSKQDSAEAVQRIAKRHLAKFDLTQEEQAQLRRVIEENKLLSS